MYIACTYKPHLYLGSILLDILIVLQSPEDSSFPHYRSHFEQMLSPLDSNIPARIFQWELAGQCQSSTYQGDTKYTRLNFLLQCTEDKCQQSKEKA